MGGSRLSILENPQRRALEFGFVVSFLWRSRAEKLYWLCCPPGILFLPCTFAHYPFYAEMDAPARQNHLFFSQFKMCLYGEDLSTRPTLQVFDLPGYYCSILFVVHSPGGQWGSCSRPRRVCRRSPISKGARYRLFSSPFFLCFSSSFLFFATRNTPWKGSRKVPMEQSQRTRSCGC